MLTRGLLAGICLQLIVSCLAVPVPPEGLHYIGIGYNLIKGNPDGNFWATGGDDPGLLATRKVLALTGDGAVNNEISYEFHQQCRQANEFAFFHDPKSYQDKLLERVTATGTNSDSLNPYAFVLSAGYKAIEQQTRKDFYVFQDKQSTCTSGQARYMVALSGSKHYLFSDEFAHAACSLPIIYDQAAYKTFIDTWGTHVINSVELGSRTIDRYIAPVKEFVEHVQNVSSRDVSIGGTYLNHASSLVVDLDSYKFRTQYRTIVGSLDETLTLGTTSNPEPIGMTAVVISDLLDSSHWQSIDDYKSKGLCPPSAEAALALIKTNLEQALTEYAGLVGAAKPVANPVAIPVTWPEGTYSLAQPEAGCPAGDFTWYEGWRLQNTESQSPDSAWSSNNHFKGFSAGALQDNMFKLHYCTKGENKPTQFDRQWPKGDYCIFKYGSCPAGFEMGYVKWDDEDSLNRNDWQGVLPDGTYDEDTLQNFCCRADGMPTESIVLPTDKPFYLFQYKRDVCQKVANMQVTEEWLRFDDEDFKIPSNSEIGTVHPGMEFWNQNQGASGSEVYYCYYYTSSP